MQSSQHAFIRRRNSRSLEGKGLQHIASSDARPGRASVCRCCKKAIRASPRAPNQGHPFVPWNMRIGPTRLMDAWMHDIESSNVTVWLPAACLALIARNSLVATNATLVSLTV
jgi:hypothetical protein